jgi:hypothetical protein
LNAWAFERRQRLELGAAEIRVAPLEYVILRKLEYYRDSGSDRHLRDVAMMLQISGDTLDEEAFVRWVERLGLKKLAAAAREYRPPGS